MVANDRDPAGTDGIEHEPRVSETLGEGAERNARGARRTREDTREVRATEARMDSGEDAQAGPGARPGDPAS
jgi:hypothetical protein